MEYAKREDIVDAIKFDGNNEARVFEFVRVWHSTFNFKILCTGGTSDFLLIELYGVGILEVHKNEYLYCNANAFLQKATSEEFEKAYRQIEK